MRMTMKSLPANKLLFWILELVKYFSRGEVLVQHKWTLFSALDWWSELLLLENFSPHKLWDLKVIIKRSDLRWDITDSEVWIPIFPPYESKFWKIYEKIVILSWVQINIFVTETAQYDSIYKNSIRINDCRFVSLENIFEDYSRQIDIKIDGYINNSNSYDGIDLVSIIQDLTIIYRFFIYKQFRQDNEIKILILAFEKIVNSFCENEIIQWNCGNINYTKTHTWIARLLDRNNLHIQNEYFNTFNSWDIILANNTSVHFMRYILKSGWIITINNNSLSHASIVSRELWRPLILGVKNLFFKIFDGDLIEMDCRTWTIKILKRFWQ